MTHCIDIGEKLFALGVVITLSGIAIMVLSAIVMFVTK